MSNLKMSDEYESDPDYEEDDTIYVNDMFLIYDQASDYTTNELYKLGFIVNKKNIEEIYWEVIMSGMKNENILKIHELFMSKIGDTSINDMFQISSDVSDDYVSSNIVDNINGYDPIIKQQFGLTYIMQFPCIDWYEVVDFDC
jgi:hypothetical protein